MWLALLLPLVVLPALVGLGRFEQLMMGGAAGTPAEPVRIVAAPGATASRG